MILRLSRIDRYWDLAVCFDCEAGVKHLHSAPVPSKVQPLPHKPYDYGFPPLPTGIYDEGGEG